MKVQLIPAFEDNYFFSVEVGSQAMLVDPGSGKEVLAHLKKYRLTLELILVTHYHGDHIDGVAELQEKTGARLYGPASLATKNLKCDRILQDKDVFDFESLKFKTLSVPGHTLDHLAYHCASSDLLFCGDTLFSLGCGRLFEGDFEMMFQSLNKLRDLSDSTAIYCAHEYTLKNMAFSLDYLKAVGASEEILKKYSELFDRLRAQRVRNEPTVPSSIQFEKEYNLFFNAKTLEEFKKVRLARNIY